MIARRRDVRGRLARLLVSLAPIKRGELITVVLLTINVFVLLTCYSVLKVAREPLILLGGGAELKAYASAGQTLLLIAGVSRMRLLTTIQLVFIGCLLAFYILARARAPIGLAFYLWLGIFSVLVVSNFWSFATDLYTPERGKRLFATIGVGASIGAVLGAFVPHLLHRVMGTSALLVVAAGGLAVSIVLYRLVDHRERSHRVKLAKPNALTEAAADRRGGFALVIKDRYLRLLAVMLLVATIINTTGEYVVGKMATDRSEVYAAEQAATSPAAATPDARAATAHDAQDEYQRVADDPIAASAHEGCERDEAMASHSGSALEHVFTVLGLVLPAEPLRIALHAVENDDSALRETALEYLESILPADVRIQLWPLLETENTVAGAAAVVADTAMPVRNARSKDELVAALNLAYPTIRASLLDK